MNNSLSKVTYFVSGCCSALLCAAATAQTPSIGSGQAFPSQPLELVAHTAPGGGTDQFVRLMGDIFTREKMVTQAPVISNRAGGGGAIAYNYVKGKKGDPHVLLAVATGTFMSALVRPDLGFSLDDFTPVAFLAMDPQVVAVTGDGKYNNVKDLIEAAKREPNTIVSAIASATGSGRLFQYMLEKQTGAKFKYVSFKSGSEAGTAVAGGHIQVTTENHSEVAQCADHERAGLPDRGGHRARCCDAGRRLARSRDHGGKHAAARDGHQAVERLFGEQQFRGKFSRRRAVSQIHRFATRGVS